MRDMYLVLRSSSIEKATFKRRNEYDVHPLWRPDDLKNMVITEIVAGSNRLFVGGLFNYKKYMVYMFGISTNNVSFKQSIETAEKPEKVKLLYCENGDNCMLLVVAWNPSFLHGHSCQLQEKSI